MRALVITIAMSLVVVAAVPSRAGNGKKEAKAAFKEGKKLFKAGDYSAAATSFRRANQLNPSWKIFYNIGQCEAAAKHHGLALQAFELYLSQGGDDIPTKRLDEVLAEVDRLRKMVGTIEIEAPEGATVLVDGAERGTTPLPGPMPVAASVEHIVAIVIDGEKSAEQTVQVLGGQSMVVSFLEKSPEQPAVEPVEEGPEEKPDPVDDEPARSPVKTWGWVAIGVGGAVAVAGGIIGGVALSMNGDLGEECDPSCTSGRKGDVDKRDNFALTADILIPTGAAIAVAGVLMVTVFSKLGDNEAEGNASLHPVIGQETIGASLEWRF